MMQVKLYFEENVPEAIAAAVRLRGYDVTTANDEAVHSRRSPLIIRKRVTG